MAKSFSLFFLWKEAIETKNIIFDIIQLVNEGN